MMKERGSIVTSWLPAAVCIGAIFFVSSIDGSVLPDLNKNGLDKVAHLVEFAILAFFSMRALRRFWPRIDLVVACAVTAGLVIACGLMDERSQLFVPHRTCSFFDFIFDFAGAALGILVFTYQEEEREEPYSGSDTTV